MKLTPSRPPVSNKSGITGVGLPVGSRVSIAPNYVCFTVNLTDTY
ncbi:hypothetical protein [Arthrobacter sp. NamB2]